METLIQLVEQHPPLWDKDNDHFKDRETKHSAWCTVVEELYGTLSEEEMQQKLKSTKTKWRNVRDAYLKCINLEKSGDPRRKKYVYADALSFLPYGNDKRRQFRPKPLRQIRPKPSGFQPQIREKLDRKEEAESEDADRSFLMSVLPDMRKLDDVSKRHFKMYVLQYFQDNPP